MNPRKRPAIEPLLPLHAPKQPRTTMTGYDGGNPSPSGNAGIMSRWKRVFADIVVLSIDSFKVAFDFTRPNSDNLEILPVHRHVQIPAELSEPPDNETLSDQFDLHPNTQHASVTLNGLGGSHSLRSPHILPENIPTSALQNSIPALPQTTPAIQPEIYTSHQMSPLDSDPSSTGIQGDGKVTRRYRNREHIYAKVHKANVRAKLQKTREEIQRNIYAIERNRGYTSNFTDFKGLLAYKAWLEKVERQDVFSPSSSMTDFHSKEAAPSRRQRSYSEADQVDDMEFLRRAFARARATLNEPRPPRPFQPTLDHLRLSYRAKDEVIEQQLRPKRFPPSPLPPEADSQVTAILAKRGVVSKFAKEQVNDCDLARLKPNCWLNDEIVNFYGAMILGRSDDCKENAAQGVNGKKLLNIHYFSTFFWSKLKEGYEKSRLAKWTKKLDIFSKDVVLIPVNHNNAHWTGAAINFRRRRIESYDSMGMRRDNVFKLLRSYMEAEYLNKKKKPFDFTGWEDYSLEEPQQENGFDCGVFTCQFLQGLSRGEEYITFTQKDIPYLRRRMIWEIGNAKLRDDP